MCGPQLHEGYHDGLQRAELRGGKTKQLVVGNPKAVGAPEIFEVLLYEGAANVWRSAERTGIYCAAAQLRETADVQRMGARKCHGVVRLDVL